MPGGGTNRGRSKVAGLLEASLSKRLVVPIIILLLISQRAAGPFAGLSQRPDRLPNLPGDSSRAWWFKLLSDTKLYGSPRVPGAARSPSS